jgi:acyl transferase domain-containing protein/NADP-dependent 3-hydroxy acid dehydrogenase YdfG/acyl carrier protein
VTAGGSRRLADNPIAIVGVAGLFPQARDHREYWQNIVDARDCTTEVPVDRWDVADYYDPDPGAPDKTYARRGGFVPDVAFDPLEFGLPPTQLGVTSTLQTLSLLVARDLLRDAGALGSAWYEPARTGVVLGVTGPVQLTHPLAARLSTPILKEVVRSCGLTDADAESIADKYAAAFAPWEENTFPGLLGNVTAGRVANRLGLGGMNSTVDAACAASLAAVRVAIAELVDGRADMMITGGCDTENSIFMYMCFSKTQALSREDRIRPFDRSADGTLLGEGIGMLALKRLADAERDGDRIYSVIRGIGSSSDGRAKSIYSPRVEGQRLALQRAYADADCSPASVELFEAHATGTAVGDATELSALNAVLQESTSEARFAAIGSVKSQIGHTKGAAGAAGLIKLAMSLYHKTLPPTINVDSPHERLSAPDSPLYVNTRTRPWIRDPRRPARRAAASAMGFGGVNFHVVLQEHRPDRPAVVHRTAQAYLWHAPDVASLTEAVRTAHPQDDAVPVPAEAARVGFVAADREAVERLRELAVGQLVAQPDAVTWTHPAGIYFRRHAMAGLKVGALFAGQGAQYLDMGLDAVLNNPAVASAFDDANAVCPIASVVYPPPVFDADERKDQESALHRTQNAQPAIGALSVGQFRYLAELGARFDGALGHSFGELTALWAAGSLSDQDFFRLAAARGAAMTPPPGDPGTMVAVNAAPEHVTELLAGAPELTVCNHNAPDQVVVGGATAAVADFADLCRGRGLTVRPLQVAAAFHTPHVAHAAAAFRTVVGDTAIGEPEIPVYANSPGARYSADVDANRAVLVQQLSRPVEFVTAVEAMRAEGCTVFVEFGPRQVLTQLVGRILADDAEVVAIPTNAGPLGDGDVCLKQAAVRLAVLGAPITGINRHTEVPPAAPDTGAAAVTLNGAEYVPESRRADYRSALADGHRVAAAPAPSPVRADDGDVVRQHLDLHSRYLEGQLAITEGLVDTLRRYGDTGPVLRAVDQVTQQVLDIGRTHIRANEILSAMIDLERDLPAPQRDLPEPAPEPVDVVEPVPVTEPPEDTRPVDVVTGDARAALLDIVAERTGYPATMLDTSMDLEADLGVDSIKRVQIFGVIQERFPDTPVLGPEQLAEIRTLDDIAALIREGDGPPVPGPTVGVSAVELVPLPPVDRLDRPYRGDPVALVVELGTRDTEVADGVQAGLERDGWTVHRLAPEGRPGADVATTLAEVGRIDLCVTALGTPVTWDDSVRLLADTIETAGQAVGSLSPGNTRAAFVTLTRLDGGGGLRGTLDAGAAVLGGVAGVVKTLVREQPAIFGRAVDVAPELGPDDTARLLLAEIQDVAAGTTEVGVDAEGDRWTVAPTPLAPTKEITFGPDDLVVVTGGARGVSAACVRALAERTGAEFVLMGRTVLSEEPCWAEGVPDDGLADALAGSGGGLTPREFSRARAHVLAQREIRATLAALGTRARYLSVDVTDARQVRDALAPFRSRVTGIVHGAAVLSDSLLPDKIRQNVTDVLQVKIDGVRSVLAAVAGAPIKQVALFTSVAGLFGNPGQADYAAANEALCRAATSLRRELPGGSVVAIDWGAWDGGMVGDDLRGVLVERGVQLIAPADGAQVFVDLFTSDHARVLAGSAEALTGGVRPAAGPAFSVRRDLTDLDNTEVLQAHRIGSDAVLPATFGLGWLVHTVERAHPGLRVVRCQDFEVHKGIVFDGDHGRDYLVDVDPSLVDGDQLVVRARVRGTTGIGTVHYGGVFTLAAGLPGQLPRTDIHDLGGGTDATSLYTDGELFHGPALRGIRRILRRAPEQLVLACGLVGTSVRHGAFGGAGQDPAVADVLLQGACLFVTQHTGRPCLPLGIENVEYIAPLPSDGEPFVVVADGLRATASATAVTVTASTPDGEVLMRLTGVTAVSAPGLAAKFAEAAHDREETG